MSNKILIEELNESWVYQRFSNVTDEDAAWVLLQEPGFIGFGVVREDNIVWPPNKPKNSPDWCLASDLRLFGEKGEWHVWRDWDGKHYARLLKTDEMTDALTEHHFLWGRKKVDINNGPWIKVVEEGRGAEIWLPLASEKLNEKSDLPLRLKLKQIVKYDPEYHLAGITDAALIGLVRSSNEDEIFPQTSLSCS